MKCSFQLTLRPSGRLLELFTFFSQGKHKVPRCHVEARGAQWSTEHGTDTGVASPVFESDRCSLA